MCMDLQQHTWIICAWQQPGMNLRQQFGVRVLNTRSLLWVNHWFLYDSNIRWEFPLEFFFLVKTILSPWSTQNMQHSSYTLLVINIVKTILWFSVNHLQDQFPFLVNYAQGGSLHIYNKNIQTTWRSESAFFLHLSPFLLKVTHCSLKCNFPVQIK